MSLFPTLETNHTEEYENYIHTFPAKQVEAILNYVSHLSQYHSDLVCNPWGDVNLTLDGSDEAATIRQRNLIAYLLPRLGRANYFVVAEAVGYQGGRFSGIAITCERMLLGLHKTVKASDVAAIPLMRTSSTTSNLLKPIQQTQGFNEPTDTVVWNAIIEKEINPYDVLLWNIFPFHPYKANAPLTNRTPTEEEQHIGWTYTKQLLDLHRELGGPEPLVLAVGQKSAETMKSFGLNAVALRHPANGGANLYRQQFNEALEAHR